MDIPEIELLTAEDEVGLARAIEAGLFAEQCLATGHYPDGAGRAELAELVALGRAAHRRFFLANLRMVAQLAHRWARRARLPVDELFQEGCVGLGEAIRRWDHARGLRFSTLAFRMVDNAISDAVLMRCGRLEVTRFRARSALQVRRTHERLEVELGRRVGLNELADKLGRDVSSVANTLRLASPTVPGTELVELAASHDQAAEVELTPAPIWLAELPADERTVLMARFGIDGGTPSSRAELASRLRLSESTVRRIELRGLARAKRLLQDAAA